MHKVANFLPNGILDSHSVLVEAVEQLATTGFYIKEGHLLLQNCCQICMSDLVGLPHTYKHMLGVTWSKKRH